MAQEDLFQRLLKAGFQKATYRGGRDGSTKGWANLSAGIQVFSVEWNILQKRVWVCMDFPNNYAQGFGSESAACEHALERAERSE